MVMWTHIKEEEEEEVEKAEGQGEGKIEVDIEVEIIEEVVVVVVEGMVYGFLIEKVEFKTDHKQDDENGMSVLQYVLCLLYSVHAVCVFTVCISFS